MAQGFTSPVYPNVEPVVAPAAVTGVVTETALYNATLYASMPAGFCHAPMALQLVVTGTVTSSAAGQTVTITPRLGTSTSGGSFGISTAIALGSTITNAFFEIILDATVRAVGSGSTGVAFATARAIVGQTAGASVAPVVALFGGSTATFDSTLAQGIFLGVTPSAVGVSIQPNQIRLVAWD